VQVAALFHFVRGTLRGVAHFASDQQQVARAGTPAARNMTISGARHFAAARV
jgi:hypothetical protein